MQVIRNLTQFNSRCIGSDLISKVLSFALILSLFQLISAVQAPISNAASTGSVSSSLKASPIPGGGPGSDNCQTGSVLYEIVASNNTIDNSSAITNTFGRCAGLNDAGNQITTNVDTTTAFGGYGTGRASASCGGNGSTRAIAGVRVFKTTNNYSAGIRIICKELPNASGTWYWSNDNMLGIAPTAKEEDLICPNGTFAVGLNVHYGGIIDAFGLNCAPVINATQASISSATLSLISKTYPYSSALSVSSISGGSGDGAVSITSVANGTATGCAFSSSSISSSTSGTCLVTVTKAADLNYAATTRTETFTFSKASLTVTASSPIVNLGDPIPTITPTYSSFVNSENASSAAFTTGLTAPTCTTSYTAASTADTSPATVCSGGSSTGYSFNYVSGKVFIVSGLDNAISLNGSNQYLVTPDNSNLDITGAFTIEAWVNPSNANARGTVVGKWLSYMLQAYDGKWAYWLGNSSTWSAIITDVPVVANEWHHIAITRAASTDSVNFYLDGNLVYTGTAGLTGTGEIRNTSSTFTIGSHNQDADFFPGKIDEVKIWNVVRSQSEIQTDLKTWGPANSSGLVAYYDFNEMVGNATVYNRSSSTFGQLDVTSRNSSTISRVETSTVSQAYTVVTFPRTYLVASGGWKIPSTVSNIKSLVIAGGGAGGSRAGGGGGAGGYVFDGKLAVNRNETYSVVVGVGGIGAALKAGTNGSNSSFGNLRIAIGGGGGGAATGASNCCERPGKSGGSGGGASGGNSVGTTLQYSTHTYGSGNNGGTAEASGNWPGGGGGGANLTTGTGGNGSGSTAGKGGSGILDPIGGTSTCYATGGGGGIYEGQTPGQGGDCGGASSPNTNGGTSSRTVPAAAKANTGSGGGGTGWFGNDGDVAGGNGASGVVIISYITDIPTILIQPLSDTTTAGIVETFTVSTSTAPTPLTKTVQWQFTADTTTGTTGWTNVSSGSGGTTDTFTTTALTKSMNKYRYRAIVTFSDTSTLSVVETSTVAILTINDSITITSDTSTITRKYGDAQTVRTITYTGGTTSTGAVGTSTSHTVRGAYGTLANGKIVLDTTTSTVVFRVDTGTVVGTYVETITVTDFKGATATYTQRIVVTQADTLTISSETPTATTYTGAQAIFTETVTVTGLVAGDAVSSVTYNYSASAATCANGGLCSVGDIGPSGGYVFYVSPTAINVASGISTGGIYLEAAPVGAQGTAEYGCTGTQTPGTSYAVGSGAANTLAIINSCATAGIAARVTSNLTYAGFSDWFMPSLDEMTAIYNNLYNKSPSLGGFTGLNYGSSSEGTNGFGYQAYWWFGAGAVSGQTNKNYVASYRPIRAFNPTYTSSVNYGPSTTKPTNASTYTITPGSVILANNVDTSNYVSVVYRTSTFTINKARQDTLTVSSILGVYDTGTATMKLATLGGTDTGTVTYTIASGGTASGCSVSSNVLTVTSAGTCKLAATKAATINYLIAYSDTATITFTRFVSNQPVQVQLYPTMIPLNGANTLETTTVTVSTLTISSVNKTGAGAYTIGGTGFSNIEVLRIGGSDLTGSNYTVGGVNSITLTGVSAFTGPLFIRKTDGQEVVYFQFDWS